MALVVQRLCVMATVPMVFVSALTLPTLLFFFTFFRLMCYFCGLVLG